MSKVETIIRDGVARCERIVAGFDDLKGFLAPVLPVRDDDLSLLPLVERIASIALLKRYEQLRDSLGRLFRACLSWEGDDVQDMTRRDQANRMEKAGIVPDAQDWIHFSDLRHRLVHEYPIRETEQVDRVNECWAAIPPLIAIFVALKQRLPARGFAL